MKEIQSLNDLEIEKIYERIFEIAKTTKNEEIELNALQSLLMFKKDKEFKKAMLEQIKSF